MTRVLLLGASGLLGGAIARAAPSDVVVTGAGEPRVDITSEDELRAALERTRPVCVINCAGETRVDEVERDDRRARAVNADALALLGRCCREIGAPLLHFSTDYVFPGTSRRPYREDDPVDPVNRYAATKLAGERHLLDSGADALIIRTQWLFGARGRSFPHVMWERATAGLTSRVVNDQVGRPTLADDLASASWRLLSLGARGIVHVANAGTASWYDLARAIYTASGRPELVTPCTTHEFPTAARRPAYSVLDLSRMQGLLGGSLPTWRDGLARYLRALRAGATATAAT